MADTSTDLKGLLISFCIFFSLSCAVLIAFTLLLRPHNRVVYEPKSKFAEPRKKPVPLSPKPFSWVEVITHTSLESSIEKIGLDAYVFLSFLRFLWKFFGFMLFFAVGLLFFHRFVPGVKTKVDNGIQLSLDVLTASNVPGAGDGYAYFYIHCIIAWTLAIFAYYHLFHIWDRYVKYRRDWFNSKEYLKGAHNRTILLYNVPESLRSEPALRTLIQRYGLKPKKIVLGRDIGDLHELVEKHNELTLKLEKVLLIYSQKRERPTHMEGGFIFGEKRDSINFYSKEIRELEAKIYQRRSRTDVTYKPNTVAFLSFDSVVDAHAAARKLRDPLPFNLKKMVAGIPPSKQCMNFSEIYWKNLGASFQVQRSKRWIGFAIVIVIIIGWSLIVSFVAALTTIERIRVASPQLAAFIQSNPALAIIVQSFLGPLLLAGLNIVLPIVLEKLAIFQGAKSINGGVKSALYKYYAFLVYQFASLIIVSIGISMIALIFKGESSDYSFLTLTRYAAQTLLGSATTYILLVAQGVFGVTVEIAQAVLLVLNAIKRRLFNLTPRERFELNSPPDFSYLVMYGQTLFMLTYGVSYSIVAPLIVPFIWISLSVTFLVYKYQLFYVYETKNETGGSYWPDVFNMTCLGLAFGQFLNTAVIVFANWVSPGGGSGKGQVIMIAILPFVSLLYWVCSNYYWCSKSQFIPKNSLHFDQQVVEMESSLEEEGQLADRMYDPAMVKPLKRVWAPDELKQELHSFHPVEYKNLLDYMQKNGLMSRDEAVRKVTQRARLAEQEERDERHLVATRVLEYDSSAPVPSESPMISPALSYETLNEEVETRDTSGYDKH